MTVKEVEERTGLTRSNIRFYEKEGLIQPLRNERNGYRAYGEADVTALERIAYLRTLGVSIEEIRMLIEGKAELRDVLTLLCLLLAVCSYGGLPERIPVQWSGGEVSSWVPRALIFAYPVLCVLVRVVLRPFIREKLGRGWAYTTLMTEYLTNFLCFVLLSVEAFTLLYLAGVAGDVRILLFVDAAAGLGLLALGLTRMGGRAPEM